MGRASGRAAAAFGVLAALGVACHQKKTNVPFVQPFTPTQTVTGDTIVFYSVQDRANEAIHVLLDVSKDGGRTFVPLTSAQGVVDPVKLANPFGTSEFFHWDSFKDLGPGLHPTCLIRGVGFNGSVHGTALETAVFTADESGSFTATTGGLARSNVAAAPLPDGSVLLAGGTNGSVPTGAVEVWDPSVESFTTSSLAVARTAIAAALLDSGRVLLAGGADVNSTALAAADVYDPVLRAIVPVPGGVATPRFDAGLAPIARGRAVLAGGVGAGGALVPSVELYDPAIGGSFFAVATDPLAAVRQPTATPLEDGRVLFAGGADASGSAVDSAFLFDPATSTVVATSGRLGSRRVGHRATRLADGRVLLAGGRSSLAGGPSALETAEVFDPATSRFQSIANMRTGRAHHGQDLAGGKVVAVGGEGSPEAAASAEVYDPDTNAWQTLLLRPSASRSEAVAVASGPGRALVAGGGAPPELFHPQNSPGRETWLAVRAPARARAGHGALRLLSGDVLLVGGTSGVASATTSVEVFRVQTETFEARADLRTARSGHTLTRLVDNRCLAVGGTGANGQVLGSLETYDVSRDAWTPLAATLAVPRTGASAILLGSGDVLIVGGRDGLGLPIAQAELFHPANDSIETTGSLSVPRADFDIARTPANDFVVAGGVDAKGAAVLPIEVYSTGARTFTTAGSLQQGRAGVSVTFVATTFGAVVAGGADASLARADYEVLAADQSPPSTVAGTRPLDVVRSFHQAIGFQGGSVLLFGGRSGPRVLDSTTVILPATSFGGNGRPFPDPRSALVRAGRTRLNTPRVGHTATLLGDGRILVVGGRDGRGCVVPGAEIFLP